MIHGAGVDVGSTQTKAVVIDEGRGIVARALTDTGANVTLAAENAYAAALQKVAQAINGAAEWTVSSGSSTSNGQPYSNNSFWQRYSAGWTSSLIDPRLLILDDATSSVDSETEGEIQHALDRLAGGDAEIAQALDDLLLDGLQQAHGP